MAAKRKRISLNEFRAWLEGVEELQANDWTPSADQWKLIRAKMNNIVAQKQQSTPAPTPQGFHTPGRVSPVQELQASLPPLPPLSPPVGGIPPGVGGMSPEAKAMMPTQPGGKSVTPNIDTTDGKYQSNFN